MKDGEHYLTNNNQFFKAYCDVLGWTLIARFSNKDHKHWMDVQGTWWYDRHAAVGNTTGPTVNADMISPAFWLTSGRELKITRSDDPTHTPVWLEKHSDQKSQATVILEMEKFGPITGVGVVAWLPLVVSTSIPKGFTQVIAMETFKTPTGSASGVTGMMDQ